MRAIIILLSKLQTLSHISHPSQNSAIIVLTARDETIQYVALLRRSHVCLVVVLRTIEMIACNVAACALSVSQSVTCTCCYPTSTVCIVVFATSLFLARFPYLFYAHIPKSRFPFPSSIHTCTCTDIYGRLFSTPFHPYL